MFCSRCGTEVDREAKFCPSCGHDFSRVAEAQAAVTDAAELSEIDVVRQVLSAEWEIDRELGRGGMAIVYKARDKHLERDVAIKVLPFSLGFDQQFVERFQREARTAARLEHPHIIPMYRVGRSGKVSYFVMKYLRGGSLSDLLERRGRLRPDEIRRLLAETAGALGYAHRHGIVHRDIKPDNIMFDELGHAVLMDFGIAKAASGTRLTGTGMSIGTPHYMSPEQARAQSLDGRSDLYSLGVVAYQAFTGQVPFDGEDAFQIGYKHIMEPLPVPPLRSDEEREVFGIIQRMLAKSQDERFQTADELAALLTGRPAVVQDPQYDGPARDRTSISDAPTAVMSPSGANLEAVHSARRPAVRSMATTPTTPIPTPQPRWRQRPKKRRGGGVLVGLFLLLFAGVGGAGGYWYFALGAEWPLPFMERLGLVRSPAVVPEDTTVIDSLSMVATLDSAAADSTRAEDTTAADTIAAPPLPPTGTLVVTGMPPQAELLVNEVARRDTIFDLEPGTYRVRVRQPGYQDYETSVPVGRGETVRPGVPAMVRVVPIEEPKPAPPPVDYCTTPDATYNRDRSCYDTAPMPSNRQPVIRLPGVQRAVRAVLWVRVEKDGRVSDLRIGELSRFGPFDRAAVQYARDSLSYRPAVRNSRPVAAWLRLPITGLPQ
ncbi:MAG: protein kinase [Gemmatimonadales bacterium]|nr:protein kinase [Gemmatimonadales bacterium]